MGKFINGMVVGALAAFIYQKQKETQKETAHTQSQSPVKQSINAIYRLKNNIEHIKENLVPQTQETIKDISDTIKRFNEQEETRFIRIQRHVEKLNSHLKDDKK